MTPGARWVGLLGIAATLLLARCSSEQDRPGLTSDDGPPPDGQPTGPGGWDAAVDAGSFFGDGGEDGGTDAGDAGLDGGKDAGRPLVLPTLEGWQFYGREQGGPQHVLGVSSDADGNIWVAGGDEGLFLLMDGTSHFRRFTVADGLTAYLSQGQKVLSVAGGKAGTVFVGYQGQTLGLDENDPPEMLTSGDADQVQLSGAGIRVTHLSISSPPGFYPQYPTGRDKIRDVFRLVYHPPTGNVWFGGNHGIALFDPRAKVVWEHQHAFVEGYLPSGQSTLLSGDYYGIGLDPAGDVWFGGGERLTKLRYASQGQFWSDLDPVVDVWPDQFPSGTHPWERTEDLVQDLAVASDGSIWVGSIANGLAHVTSSGTELWRGPLAEQKVTALELDPLDGSLWVGHIWNGLTRISGRGVEFYDWSVLGPDLANLVPDIQSDFYRGRRRILVAFESGAIGIFTGD